MEKNEKISVVVPIYNVEEYLPRCLDSIIAQTYSNIEILLVDDGSPDNAGAICDKYAEQDSRIRVFHIPNGGVARARQLGVENSTGEYIVFVDADDYLTDNSIFEMYDKIDDNIDIVIGCYTIIYSASKKSNFYVSNEIVAGTEYLRMLLLLKINIAPWAKLYRKSLFGTESFPNFNRGQDFMMNVEVAMKARTVKFIEKITYCYQYSTPNSSVKRNKVTIETQLKKIEFVKDNLKKFKLEKSFEKEFALLKLRSYYGIIIVNGNTSVQDFWLRQTINELRGVHMSFFLRVVIWSAYFKPLRKIIYYTKKMLTSNVNILRTVHFFKH